MNKWDAGDDVNFFEHVLNVPETLEHQTYVEACRIIEAENIHFLEKRSKNDYRPFGNGVINVPKSKNKNYHVAGLPLQCILEKRFYKNFGPNIVESG